MEHLGIDSFKAEIFDFEASKEWNYKGDKPAIIKFYADWCSPCRAFAPIVEEVEQEMNGKVKFYQVNTEEQQELAGMFGISSIPAIVLIPMEGQPAMSVGMLPKETLHQAISEVLKVEKDA